MKNFIEYMNSKGTIESPSVKVVADKVDCPEGRKYAPEQKGTNGTLPYSNGKTVKTEKSKGFGDQGHTNLKYAPGKPEGKSCAAAKLPTAEHYDLFQAVREAIQEEPTFVEQLIREFKRNGLLPVLVGEMVGHRETFSHLAEVMASESYGREVCKKFARALREDVAPPFSRSVEEPVDGMNLDGEDDEFSDEEIGLDGEGDLGDEFDDEEGGEVEIGPDGLPIEPELGDEQPEIGPDGQPVEPEIGPDGLPIQPEIGPDGQPVARRDISPTPPAMENLLSALNVFSENTNRR